MPVRSTVEAQPSLHKRNIAKEPQKCRNVKKPVARSYEPESALAGVTVLCPISELHDPECINQSSTGCMVTRTCLVPACSSLAGL